MLIRAYGIPIDVGARLARSDESARSPAKGYVTVYECQFKFGLRFLVFRLLKEVIEHYELLITQISSHCMSPCIDHVG